MCKKSVCADLVEVEPQVVRVTKLSGRMPNDPLRAVVEAKVNGLTLRGLKLELHRPHHWRLVPPGRKIQQHWQIVYDFSTRSVYDCLLRKVVTAYGGDVGNSIGIGLGSGSSVSGSMGDDLGDFSAEQDEPEEQGRQRFQGRAGGKRGLSW